MTQGILIVDKPAGWTSHDVVAKLRGICATKKVGHGGTLDPMATGVLPVFVGGAVKAVDLAPNQDKAYHAEVCFGIATDTGDITGAVLEEAGVSMTREQVENTLPRFLGPQKQLPPMYSAVKVDGRPLYHYARKGQEVKRKERAITVHAMELLARPAAENRFWLAVECSKGTYIRTLVEDVGKALGVPATLSALRRTRAGVFAEGEAHTLEAIQAARDEGRLDELFCPVERLFEGMPAVRVDEAQAGRLFNGAPVYRIGDAGRCRLLLDGTFLGLGQIDAEGTLRAEKIFNRPPSEAGPEG